MKRIEKTTRFKKTVFENGLTLLSERQENFRGLSLGVWVKAGTRHEKQENLGITGKGKNAEISKLTLQRRLIHLPVFLLLFAGCSRPRAKYWQ